MKIKRFICLCAAAVFFGMSALPMQAEAVNMKLNKTNITMAAGTSYTLELEGASGDVEWSSSKKSVVRIKSTAQSFDYGEYKESGEKKASGVTKTSESIAVAEITAKKPGKAKIIVNAQGRKYTCRIQVVSAKLVNKKKTLETGKAFTIKTKGKRISKWRSSDPSVAAVNANGKVTARKAGKVTITGTVGVSKLKCVVTVKPDRWEKLLDKYSRNEDVRQVVFVKYSKGSKAKVLMYGKTNEKWDRILECTGYVGKRGIGKKKEGDKKTPTGVFNLTQAFGIKKNPGTTMPYIDVDENLYWCGDKKYYNQLVDTRKTTHKCKGEHLADYVPQYNYGIVLDYNQECVYKKGSAIFLHCKGSNAYTAGCIAVSQKNMIKIMKNIEPGAKICIYKQ